MKSIITICEKNHYEIGLDSLEKLKEELERTGICWLFVCYKNI